MQHIHRYAIVDELASIDGAALYSATLPGSPLRWNLLKWAPPPASVNDARREFLRLSQAWNSEGIEWFVHREALCLASPDRNLLRAKAAVLRQTGVFGPAAEAVLAEPGTPAPNAVAPNAAEIKPAPPLPAPAPVPRAAIPPPAPPPPMPKVSIPPPPPLPGKISVGPVQADARGPAPAPRPVNAVRIMPVGAIQTLAPAAAQPPPPTPQPGSWWKWIVLTGIIVCAAVAFVEKDQFVRHPVAERSSDTTVPTEKPQAAESNTPATGHQKQSPIEGGTEVLKPSPGEKEADPVQKEAPPVVEQPVEPKPQPEEPKPQPEEHKTEPAPRELPPSPSHETLPEVPVIQAPPPQIISFDVEPKRPIQAGKEAVLHWIARNADCENETERCQGITLEQRVGSGPLTPKGHGQAVDQWKVSPKTTTRYVLEVRNKAGNVVQATLDVEVIPDDPKVLRFVTTTNADGSFDLIWDVTGAKDLQIQLAQKPQDSKFEFSCPSPRASAFRTVYWTSPGVYVFRLTATSPTGKTVTVETSHTSLPRRQR